jgi:predicted DNA-binding ribbon-helix-helix protein
VSRHLRKRSFRLAGHRTSVALEPEFWAALDGIAARRAVSLSALVAAVDAGRVDPTLPLASALRVFCLAAADKAGQGKEPAL